ncbi:MAG: DUF21 domain-containing protein, partial [Acidimicrobiales bacterium]|nr:DUF21 domain-containing protein [Acidimicrobiales bacterium]
MTAWALVASVAMLLLNAFFVAVEFALVASRRPKLEALAGDAEPNRRLRTALHSL